jgi:hypothetical protein
MERNVNVGRFLQQILLFVSAYFPLFVILTIKYLSSLPYPVEILVVLLALGIVLVLFWISLINRTSDQTLEEYEVLDYKREINYPMSYLLAYIVSIIGFNLDDYLALISFMALLIFLFIVYSGSDALFLNPLLYIRGYKFYDIKARRTGLPDLKEGKSHLHALLISSENRFQTGERILLRDLSPGVMIEPKGAKKK